MSTRPDHFLRHTPLWIKLLLPVFLSLWVATSLWPHPVLSDLSQVVTDLGWLSLWFAIAAGTALLKLNKDNHTAKQQAIKSNRIKDAYLGVINHEIRTPLNGMLGVTELLREQALPTELRDGIETLNASGRRMVSALAGIDDLIKLQEGRLEPQLGCFDLARSVQSVGDLMHASASEKGLSVSVRLDPVIPTKVIGDESRLRYILIQLLDNAIKFSTHGNIAVDSRLVEKHDHRLLIQISVRDQGKGIPEDQQRSIFLASETPVVSSLRRNGNIGQGLPLCHSLVELLGGSMWVESKEGEGAKFLFTLPLVADQAAEEHQDRRRSREELQVLVAEDNPVNQKVMLALLRRLGVEADLVENGAQAVSASRTSHYDFIFMDIEMPELDGITATREILTSHRPDSPPVIVPVTATVLPNDTKRFADAGMTGLIQKPVTLDKLKHILGLAALPEETHRPGPSIPAEFNPADFVDFRELQDLCGDDLETQNSLIQLFIEESQGDLEKIQHAAANSDLVELRHRAHRLVGSSRTVGAIRIASICSQLELDTGLSERKLSPLVKELDEAFEQTCRAFTQGNRG